MALKYELEQWGAAVEAYDAQNYENALRLFETIAESAKFHFNMGLIYATLGEHEAACLSFKQAIECDQYFAVAYFQKGVSHFLLQQFEMALRCFDDALRYLRGNILIDYEQLGLKFRLYSCEVLFNRGLCYLYFGELDNGMRDLYAASKEKETEDHQVIDEAIQTQGQGFAVFSIPVGIIYRPSEVKLKNVKVKDYLGKAKLVAAVDPEDAFTGFTGAQKKQTAQSNTTTPIKQNKTDGKVDNIGGNAFLRPGSLSSDPRKAPFPVVGNLGRDPSFQRDQLNSPTIPSILERTNSTRTLRERNPADPSPDANSYYATSSRSKKPDDLLIRSNSFDNGRPSRSNTYDNGRPSPKFTSMLQRQNSLRNIDTTNQENSRPLRRENSLRTNALNDRSDSRDRPQVFPQRANTQMRTQFLQRQLKANISNYGAPPQQQLPPPPTQHLQSPTIPPIDSLFSNEDLRIESFNQLYDFMLNNDDYDLDVGVNYNSPILNGNSSNLRGTNGGDSSSRTPSFRGRASPLPTANNAPQERGVAYKPSTLQNDRGMLSASPEPISYASLIFNKDGDKFLYNEDETQFEILAPPSQQQKSPSTSSNSSSSNSVQSQSQESPVPIEKLKVKCYYKDTRVILVPASIKFNELTQRIQEKFSSSTPLLFKYKDEEGEMVMLTDQEDLEMVIELISSTTSDKIGRMELWVVDP
ncbi:9270_t:CDS:2 [Ambispora leptoticha]|uniref:9270_t:CDS:1 n=1 Tax=Ambispora leptoticha TaxID=144679 RepID=A0A9N8YRN7_9GLOM|nr:9270_t:CDS:2 [Ambispora leptoticha]